MQVPLLWIHRETKDYNRKTVLRRNFVTKFLRSKLKSGWSLSVVAICEIDRHHLRPNIMALTRSREVAAKQGFLVYYSLWQ